MYSSIEFDSKLGKLFSGNGNSNYYAHLRDDCNETLLEHSGLVYDYFKELIRVHKLEKPIKLLIDNLIGSFTNQP